MPFLFNLPVTDEGNALSDGGIAYYSPYTTLYELNWIGLLTYGFVVSTIQWSDANNVYPATWVGCSCGFNC